MTCLAHTISARIETLKRDSGIPLASAPKGKNLQTAKRWADALRRGAIFFYDKKEVQIGKRHIDWSGAHLAHQEWPAQLNRFFWLNHLVNAWRDGYGEDLPELAAGTIADWMDQRDFYAADKPIGLGDNTLNLSIRLGQATAFGWWNAAAAFAGTEAFDDKMLNRMLASTRGQLEFLRAHLSSYGNWRISQLNCILFCSLVLPDMDDFTELAAGGLRAAFFRQVESDGAHCEHTPGYHGWMARVFSRLWRLGQARPELELLIDADRLLRMWDYSLAASAPDGRSSGLHDSGRWQESGADGKAFAAREKMRRELGDAVCNAWEPKKEPSRYFPDAGQIFLRDSWETDSMFVTFDASNWGGAHCHLSRLAVNLYAGDRMLLCDPGVFSYEMADPFAAYGKSTPAHNTLVLDGRNQTLKNPEQTFVEILPHYALAGSKYDGGYCQGTYTWWFDGFQEGMLALHERVILQLKFRALLVFDRIAGPPGMDAPFALNWQFPAGTCQLDAGKNRAWTRSGRHNILVQTLRSTTPMAAEIHEGETDPIRGWLPLDAFGGRTPAPQLTFTGQTQPVAEVATLLLPFVGDTPPSFTVRPVETDSSLVQAFQIDWDGGESDFIAIQQGFSRMIGDCGPLSTDAALAAVHLKAGQPVRAMLHQGFSLDFNDRRLIKRTSYGTCEVTVEALGADS